MWHSRIQSEPLLKLLGGLPSRPSLAGVCGFLIFHETEAIARARGCPVACSPCRHIYLAVPSSQALWEAPFFSHGRLEGLEGWYDAQQDLISSPKGLGPPGADLRGRTHTHASTPLTINSPQPCSRLAQSPGCAPRGLVF